MALLCSASPIAAGPAVGVGASVGLTREPRRGCPAELEVAFDLGGRAAVEPLENPFALLRAELVQQLVSADSTRLSPGVLLSQQCRHRLGEVATIGYTYRSPFGRPANRALVPPTPRNDEEVMPAEDRPLIVATPPDASGLARKIQARAERITSART